MFGFFYVNPKTCVTFSGGSDRPGQLGYAFFHPKWCYSDFWHSYLNPWLWCLWSWSFRFFWVIIVKRLLNLPNLHVGYMTFVKLQIVLPTKVNLLFVVLKHYSLFLRQILFSEIFSKSCNFGDPGIYWGKLFQFRTDLKLHYVPVTAKMVNKKVIADFNSPKPSCLNCIPLLVWMNCKSDLSHILADFVGKALLLIIYHYYNEKLLKGQLEKHLCGNFHWLTFTTFLSQLSNSTDH